MADEPKRATYQDIIDAPEHLIAEIVDGRLYTSRGGTMLRSHVFTQVVRLLGAPHHRVRDGGPGGWYLLPRIEVHLGDDVVVPEVSGWRTPITLGAEDEPITNVPDWICEVLSPSTAALCRVHKLRVYARAGVRDAWLLDPAARSLEVLSLDPQGRWVIVATFCDDAVAYVAPFLELELELGKLWPEARSGSR